MGLADTSGRTELVVWVGSPAGAAGAAASSRGVQGTRVMGREEELPREPGPEDGARVRALAMRHASRLP